MHPLRFCFVRIRAWLGSPHAMFELAVERAGRNLDIPAFGLFAKAARFGLPAAQYRTGRCYLLGLGVPPSINEALRWLARAASNGNIAAQTQLGSLALQGVVGLDAAPKLFDHAPGEPDYHTASHWCRQAGSPEAKAMLAFILTAGPADLRDQAAGAALYHEAAQAGSKHGKLGSALALLQQRGAAETAEAVRLLHEAAADGVAAAHHLLGVLAESGVVVPVNFSAAATHYREAALLGHAPAQVRFGFALLAGRGLPMDLPAAETWLRRAALAGEGQAAAVVGYLCAKGGDLPPNPAEAALWLQRAAEAGHAAAARLLGQMLLVGSGLPRDREQAVHWLQVAAKADDPAAQFELGVCLAQAIGVDQDEPTALHWIRRSADAGHLDAVRLIQALQSGHMADGHARFG